MRAQHYVPHHGLHYGPSYVHDLNNDMFTGFVENNDLVAVAFVLPWLCNYERLSENMKRYNSDLYLQTLERLATDWLYRQLE